MAGIIEGNIKPLNKIVNIKADMSTNNRIPNIGGIKQVLVREGDTNVYKLYNINSDNAEYVNTEETGGTYAINVKKDDGNDMVIFPESTYGIKSGQSILGLFGGKKSRRRSKKQRKTRKTRR